MAVAKTDSLSKLPLPKINIETSLFRVIIPNIIGNAKIKIILIIYFTCSFNFSILFSETKLENFGNKINKSNIKITVFCLAAAREIKVNRGEI